MPTSITDRLSKWFNITVLDPNAPSDTKEARSNASTATSNAQAAVAPTPDKTKAVDNSPKLCEDIYRVINCQYPEETKDWPEKICVFKKGEAIRWYSLVQAPEPKE